MADITETLAPKSDQLDNLELRGGHRIFTVTSVDVHVGADQPIQVHLAEFPRPWRPGKNMRRVLAHCWGNESDDWVGHRVELFSDEKVKFGNDTPGGTRISRLSHIQTPQVVALLVGQGKAGSYKVDPLPADVVDKQADRVAGLRAEWKTADPDRKAAIKAEVAELTGGAA